MFASTGNCPPKSAGGDWRGSALQQPRVLHAFSMKKNLRFGHLKTCEPPSEDKAFGIKQLNRKQISSYSLLEDRQMVQKPVSHGEHQRGELLLQAAAPAPPPLRCPQSSPLWLTGKPLLLAALLHPASPLGTGSGGMLSAEDKACSRRSELLLPARARQQLCSINSGAVLCAALHLTYMSSTLHL